MLIRRSRAEARPQRTTLVAQLAALLLVASLAALAVLGGGATATTVETAAGAAPAAAGGRTWVVDAYDGISENVWQSVDTGTGDLTIAVGDTVEWQFDRATQGHDLVSIAADDPRYSGQTQWPDPVAEYREPGGEPVRHTFDQPGTYRYECSLHSPLMSGTIVVLPADTSNAPPTADPVVEPTSGPAPLAIHATANASDPDGDDLVTSWDFGTGAAPTLADHAMFEYTQPGQYVVRLRVDDGRGGVHEEQVAVTVTSGDGPTDPEPPADEELPSIDALAAPREGTAPAAVAFSTQVVTRGTVRPFADGVASHPDLTGAALLVRRRDFTSAAIHVTGAEPSAAHPVHVHERACADADGGSHFRFDTSEPFSEANELWPAFTADADGASGHVEVSKPMRAGPLAVSVVVHDPANPARRIACADLAPGTAGLTYHWDFGDGTTGTGADPDHTYAVAGTYTATVTVRRPSGAAVTDTVRVEVGAPDPTPDPSPTPDPGPGPDVRAPRVSILGAPSGTVRTRRATVGLVADEAASFECRLDRGAWRPCAGSVTYGPLREGRHRLRVRATDAAGNTGDAVRASWTVDRTGPKVSRTRPRGVVRTPRPTVRATLEDRWSAVRRSSIRVRVDGRKVRGVRYAARRGVLRWTPPRRLTRGRHVVRVVARDALGNRSARTWRFTVR